MAGVLVWADWLFTTPNRVVRPLTGFWLLRKTGFRLTEPWLLAAHASYLPAFLCGAPFLHLQPGIRDLCRAAPGPDIPPQAFRRGRPWFALRWPAFAALVPIFWLMVAKPAPF